MAFRSIKRLYVLLSVLSAATLLLITFCLFWRNGDQESLPLNRIEPESLEYSKISLRTQKKTLTKTHHRTLQRFLTINSTCYSYRNHSNPRYVLGLNYWEQMNMALGNMFALACLASDWIAHVVRPFTFNSRLYGLPSLRADDNWLSDVSSMLPLNMIFDTNYLDLLACSYGISNIAELNDFLLFAQRSITVMHFIHDREPREKSVLSGQAGERLHYQLRTEFIFECDQLTPIRTMAQDIMSSLNKEAKTLHVPEFRLARYFCINASSETTPKQLADKCQLNGNISVIVLNWRGLTEKRVIKASAKGIHKSQRLLISNLSLQEHPKGTNTILRHSWQVLGNTSLFLKSLKLSYAKFIGIHIRSEKLGIRDMRIENFTKKCLQRTLKLRDQLIKDNPNIPTVVFTDYGPYGSDSCFECRGAKTVQQFLQVYGITPVHFDPSIYNAYQDSGFVAAVEMELLSKAQEIILVGGGAFQKQIALRIQKHKKQASNRAFHVCWDDKARIKHPYLKKFREIKSLII